MVSCQPRYHVDELSTPSLERICAEFLRLGYKNIDIDTDLIMSWELQGPVLNNHDGCCRKATINDLDCITRVFSASFGYDDSNWLKYKLKTQLLMSDTFQLFVTEDQGVIASVVILHMPLGLPHLGHVNSVATHPDYQRKGMASVCLSYALQRTCKAGQKFYLETYDDLYHAHRMYEKVGFKHEGLLKSSMIAFNDNK
ncbi:acyl-CoA N-acyltransferase [Mucor mucedo]|uniref:acyl-CoA N-acyltransferase n=1 Tax=Mucor mucedo TaxID=29922 RepID=UPI00221F51B8|nr:acyl-CoA N-acyltransferase [Mucor mucedo]KAI7883817.1 acyl-CoA N-acyltransferase [Mucor mucedo]